LQSLSKIAFKKLFIDLDKNIPCKNANVLIKNSNFMPNKFLNPNPHRSLPSEQFSAHKFLNSMRSFIPKKFHINYYPHVVVD